MALNTATHPMLSKSAEGEILAKSGMRLQPGSAQTRGTFELLELQAPGSRPPHVHQDHDKCFYVIQGSYTFTLDLEQVEARAGSIVFLPRGVRHTFTPGPRARALAFSTPGGFLEDFFRELPAGLEAGRPEAELRAELAGRYDAWPTE